MEASHDSLHSGCPMAFRRTLAKLRSAYVFPKEFSIVTDYCRFCETCARKRPFYKKDKVQHHPIPIVGEFARSGSEMCWGRLLSLRRDVGTNIF